MSAQYTRQTKKYAMTSLCLDRKEVRYATLLVRSTGTGRPVETQDVFFWRLAGWSAPTGLAIVHWIGCINAIKLCFSIFGKKSKIQNGCHMWEEENFFKNCQGYTAQIPCGSKILTKSLYLARLRR